MPGSSSLDDDPGAVEALLDRAASVESQMELAQFQQQLLAALFQLSPRQRAVIVQRYYLEMNEREMAQASGAAAGTIKRLLSAARKRLSELLGQKGGSHE